MNKAIFELKAEKPVAQEIGPYHHKNQGKVPQYLNKYAKEREEDAKKKAQELEMSKHPPGTRLMPEEERQETLRDLREAQAATKAKYESLPVVAHSGKMERHKVELEEKMSRLEKAIATFSKPTVYVAM